MRKKLRCLKAIRRAEVDDARRFLLAKLVELYVELDEVQAERFAAETRKADNQEVREMVITWEETLAASKAEGEAAMRRSIQRVLQQRLQSVPAFVRERLDAIHNVERLEEIHDQALTVNSANELVLDG